jgi:hypothetical protein
VNNLTKLARRQLAMHEALRRLGFSADDIYVRFANSVGDGTTERFDVFTELKVGALVFKSNYRGEKKVTKAAYEEVYKREAAWWNDAADEAEKLKIYQREFPVPVLLSLTEALQRKGFVIPKLERGDA